MAISNEEKKALREKLNHPDKTVRCPRCGNELLVERRGNSIAVECRTKGCICGGIRGV